MERAEQRFCFGRHCNCMLYALLSLYNRLCAVGFLWQSHKHSSQLELEQMVG
jgi:hypothetical protein